MKLKVSRNIMLSLITALLVLVFSFTSRAFFTLGNFSLILNEAATLAWLGLGLTFVLAAGEIDLSFPSLISLSGILFAMALETWGSLLLALALVLLAALSSGFLNGFLVSRLRVPSFLVTLGVGTILTGLARSVSGLRSIAIPQELFLTLWGGRLWGFIPASLLWLALAAPPAYLLLNRSVFGKHVLAIGGNKVSALYSGVPVKRIQLLLFPILAVCASMTGLFYGAQLGVARFDLGSSDLMTVLAAVLIGGTSLFGGKANLPGTLLGSLVMSIIGNGLILMGLSLDQQIILRGIIIITAVILTMRSTEEQ